MYSEPLNTYCSPTWKSDRSCATILEIDLESTSLEFEKTVDLNDRDFLVRNLHRKTATKPIATSRIYIILRFYCFFIILQLKRVLYAMRTCYSVNAVYVYCTGHVLGLRMSTQITNTMMIR